VHLHTLHILKATTAGLLLNFKALCPMKWKSGLVSCLLNHVKSICSNQLLFNNEVLKLCQMFFLNGYPYWFFNKILRHFLSNVKGINKQESIEIDPTTCYVNKCQHENSPLNC